MIQYEAMTPKQRIDYGFMPAAPILAVLSTGNDEGKVKRKERTISEQEEMKIWERCDKEIKSVLESTRKRRMERDLKIRN